MRRPPFIALIVSAAALLSLYLPALASAGTYTWAQPGNFTAGSPGANPDHDAYGETPWSYDHSATSQSHAPGTYSLLSPFATGLDGGLSGWGGGTGQALVAINPTNHAITNGSASYPAGQLVLQPGAGRFAAVGWTAPLTGTVQVSGTFTQDDGGSGLTCAYMTSWSVDQGGAQGSIAAGALPGLLPGSGTFSRTVSVTQGQTIDFTVSNGLLGSPACDATSLAVQITAPGTTPHVSLDTPANGALISGGHPTFSGSADQSFGASSAVTVRVYAGNLVSGAPVRTLGGTRSGGSYAVTPNSPLPDGNYTAQAEQDDLASPSDAGLSSAIRFVVHNGSSSLVLNSLGSKPLLHASPTLTGTAGIAPGDANVVALAVYPGSDTNTTPVRLLSGTVDSGGHFSVKVTPGLDDGEYTAVAIQNRTGSKGFSRLVSFRIKVHGPALTLALPGAGSTVSDSRPLFSGHAGNRLGDSSRVTVNLYTGRGTGGKRVGTIRLQKTGGSWSGRFPFSLGPQVYTVQAVQSDDAGHVVRSQPHTFLVVPAPTVIGATVRLSRKGVLTVPVACIAAAGQICQLDVLALTVSGLQAVPGGPVGRLRLLFSYLSIPSGQSVTVRATLPRNVLSAIRRAGKMSVRVTVTVNRSGASAKTFSAVRRLS
jgi:hypothetical protein